MKKSMVCVVVLLLTACPEKRELAGPAAGPQAPTLGKTDAPAAALSGDAGSSAKPKHGSLSRAEFNQRAQEHFTPLFWRSDANDNRVIDPEELVVLVGPHGLKRQDFVDDQGFTPLFEKTYETLTAPFDFSKADPAEKKRLELLQAELEQGRPTLVETDFSKSSEQDRAIISHLLRASALVDTIFNKQRGSHALQSQVPATDVLSQAVFYRNHGPWCVAPKTEKDPDCNALASKPKHVSGLYPAKLQDDPKFCELLQKERNAADLMGHFSVVTEGAVGTKHNPGFTTVPYNVAYADDMKAVADELTQAANAIASADEQAFKTYLLAAAKAFTTNDWESANAPWVAMGPTNSKWFLRIAPDEVYDEPCAWKAGFAVQLARINPDSLEWQKKLEPVKGDMEKTLAAFAGPPYKARDVKFKLPDFIDVVVNSGDQRSSHGGTVGQSLPNWGKVADKGGRTVVMTNLFTDVDSAQALNDQAASLLCTATMKQFTTDPKIANTSVLLHEASHNLGPAHEYKVKGKVDDEVFGGPLASMLEELKAQTSALYFSEWLVDRGLSTKEDALKTHVRDVTWAFGHISRGMYDGAGKAKPYSQLAAIQLGTLLDAKVLEWKKDEKAANGQDVGCFEVDLEKWKPIIGGLAKRVLIIKGTGDKKDAELLKATYVDNANDAWAALRGTIGERWLRAPKATLVYSVTP